MRAMTVGMWMGAVLLQGTLAGCDPYGGSDGIVVDPGGAPLEGATVTLHCPAPNKTVTARTDARGRYSVHGVAMGDASCVVTLEKPGFETKKLPVTQTCRIVGAGTMKCSEAPPSLTLTPLVIAH